MDTPKNQAKKPKGGDTREAAARNGKRVGAPRKPEGDKMRERKIYLLPALDDRVEETARREKRSVSGTISRIVQQYFDEGAPII